jgi:hypothetical protein
MCNGEQRFKVIESEERPREGRREERSLLAGILSRRGFGVAAAKRMSGRQVGNSASRNSCAYSSKEMAVWTRDE